MLSNQPVPSSLIGLVSTPARYKGSSIKEIFMLKKTFKVIGGRVPSMSSFNRAIVRY